MASDTATGRSILGYLSLTGFPAVVEIERTFLAAEAMAKYDTLIAEYDPRRCELCGNRAVLT
jgi:hypothetical protein